LGFEHVVYIADYIMSAFYTCGVVQSLVPSSVSLDRTCEYERLPVPEEVQETDKEVKSDSFSTEEKMPIDLEQRQLGLIYLIFLSQA
jgi:hypothetical protein